RPLLADVDLVVGRDHLALQPHAVEMEHAHSAVAVLVQATHELDRHSLPDVHLERVVFPAKFEVSCLDRLPTLCRLDGDRVVELRVPPGT
ncbi:MAG: hypothetical protein ACK56F_03910, partial [bacterium]